MLPLPKSETTPLFEPWPAAAPLSAAAAPAPASSRPAASGTDATSAARRVVRKRAMGFPPWILTGYDQMEKGFPESVARRGSGAATPRNRLPQQIDKAPAPLSLFPH